MNAARAYARATNETASKERLMVLLFEAALKHMRAGASHLEAGDVKAGLPLLTKASDIVTELAATLNAAMAPELAELLGDVYLFVTQRLAVASLTKAAAPVREAERAFAPVVEGFQQAVAQMAGGQVEAR
ncbi:MAG: flagellar protein FliS [Myxococcaceae bacterium]|nr:flagellar protein FliS [Myxococcaceae bacterium]